MPFDRFALVLVVVIAAAGLTVWIGTTIAASAAIPAGWLSVIPLVLGGTLLWRGLANRSNTPDGPPNDRTKT
ncbi:MAG: hypothetical protein VX874_19145 [Pseudomonadota bacterium]|nr:hypothetical protein [Pseudomonadota bacterium]